LIGADCVAALVMTGKIPLNLPLQRGERWCGIHGLRRNDKENPPLFPLYKGDEARGGLSRPLRSLRVTVGKMTLRQAQGERKELFLGEGFERGDNIVDIREGGDLIDLDPGTLPFSSTITFARMEVPAASRKIP
jgi:hypothetical protein